MVRITIRIEDNLKERIAAAADRLRKTPHAFVLDAIAQSVEHTELDDVFHRVAEKRWANLLATGKSVLWEEAKAWIEARSRGERAP